MKNVYFTSMRSAARVDASNFLQDGQERGRRLHRMRWPRRSVPLYQWKLYILVGKPRGTEGEGWFFAGIVFQIGDCQAFVEKGAEEVKFGYMLVSADLRPPTRGFRSRV